MLRISFRPSIHPLIIPPSMWIYLSLYTPNKTTTETARRIQSSSMSQTTFEMQIHPIVKSSWTLAWWWCMTKFIFFLNEPLARFSFLLMFNLPKAFELGVVESFETFLSHVWHHVTHQLDFRLSHSELFGSRVRYLAIGLSENYFLIAYQQLVFPLFPFRFLLTNHNLHTHNAIVFQTKHYFITWSWNGFLFFKYIINWSRLDV